MTYRRLGSTGLEVSPLALGCGNFGGIGSAPAFYGQGDTEADAIALMDHAWDAGINVFDTADAYGGGRSEAYIGRWLAARGAAAREQLVLTSKVFNPVGPGPNERGLSRVHILRQVEASLTRLQTDRIDLYLMHEPDPATPLDETLGAFEALLRAGKVLYVGASNIEAWRLAEAIGASARLGITCACVQNSYSLLDRAAEREVLPLCAASGVGFTAFSPLAGGWLSGKYREGEAYPSGSRMTLRPEPYRNLERAAIFRGLAALAEHARARGVSVATLAIAWVLQNPRVSAAIVGPRHIAHLEAAIAAIEMRWSAHEAQEMAGLFDAVAI